jgi:hypothetical protein
MSNIFCRNIYSEWQNQTFYGKIGHLKGTPRRFSDMTGIEIFFSEICILFDVGINQILVCELTDHSITLFFQNHHFHFAKWHKNEKHSNAFHSNQANNHTKNDFHLILNTFLYNPLQIVPFWVLYLIYVRISNLMFSGVFFFTSVEFL